MTHGTEDRSGIRAWESLGDGGDVWKQLVSGLHWLCLSRGHIRFTQETCRIRSPQIREIAKKKGMGTDDVFREGSIDTETTVFCLDAIWKKNDQNFHSGIKGLRDSYPALSLYGTVEDEYQVRNEFNATKKKAHKFALKTGVGKPFDADAVADLDRGLLGVLANSDDLADTFVTTD